MKIFKQEDQLDFAQLSGDYNPLHMDPVISRRLLFGKSVVHGLNLLLWSLEEFVRKEKSKLALDTVEAKFIIPVGVNDDVEIEITLTEGLFEVVFEKDNICYAVIKFKYELKNFNTKLESCSAPKWIREPKLIPSDKILNYNGKFEVKIDIGMLKKVFPFISQFVDIRQIAFLISTSRLVGMKCPGLNSIYSELKVKFNKSEYNRVEKYSVTKFDKRFNVAEIIVGNGFAKIITRIRPTPKNQKPFHEIFSLIKKNEFHSINALVVGGARGLGEVTVKILAAGNAKVCLTYFQGENDAMSIFKELHQHNFTNCEVEELDIVSASREELMSLFIEKNITHLYYFATPFIFCGHAGIFNISLYNKFNECYINGFLNVVDILKETLTHVFVPSTDALTKFQPNMVEYTAVKSALETICQSIVKGKKIKILNPRMPRTATDQTNSLIPVHNNDPVNQMIEFIRQLDSNTLFAQCKKH